MVEIQTERAACSLQYSLAVRSLFPNLRASGQDAYRNLSLLVKSRIIIISATASVRVRESTRRSFSDTWSFSTFRIWKLNERNDKLKRSLISTSSFPSQSKSSALTAERQFNVIFSSKSDITLGFLIMLCPAVFFLAAISPYQTAGREQERGRVVCQRFIPPSLSYAFFATYFLLQSFTLLRTPILNPRYVRWTFSFPFHGHQTKG